MKKIKVLIVEEYEGIIQVFRRLLRTTPDIEIIWEARSEVEAILALEMFKPDIILINFASSGRQATKIWKEIKMQAPESRLVALTIPENPNLIRQAKMLGVTFLAKEEMVRTLVPTIRTLVDHAERAPSPLASGS